MCTKAHSPFKKKKSSAKAATRGMKTVSDWTCLRTFGTPSLVTLEALRRETEREKTIWAQWPSVFGADSLIPQNVKRRRRVSESVSQCGSRLECVAWTSRCHIREGDCKRFFLRQPRTGTSWSSAHRAPTSCAPAALVHVSHFPHDTWYKSELVFQSLLEQRLERKKKKQQLAATKNVLKNKN